MTQSDEALVANDKIKEAVELLEKIAATNGPSMPPPPGTVGGSAGRPIPRTESQKMAIIALDAIRLVGSGTHVIIPKEPTEKMLDAGVEASANQRVSLIYRAMIQAFKKD